MSSVEVPTEINAVTKMTRQFSPSVVHDRFVFKMVIVDPLEFARRKIESGQRL
ncbi:MAG: hypothetical protein ACK5PB_08265 [Pirellula sp.]